MIVQLDQDFESHKAGDRIAIGKTRAKRLLNAGIIGKVNEEEPEIIKPVKKAKKK